MNLKNKTIMVMAGGTGGHVIPALSVAKELQSRGCKVIWLGTRSGIEATLVPKAGIDISYITINGVRGKGLVGLFQAPFKIIKAIAQSLIVIKQLQPFCVLGFGGFVSGPGAIAARIMRLPLMIHEQNAIAGTTNTIASKMAHKVFVSFPNVKFSGVDAQLVGNPVRKEIVRNTRNSVNEPLNILIVGGSLGAKAINELIPELIQQLPFEIKVRHQTGKSNFEQMSQIYKQMNNVNVEFSTFIDDMSAAYAWADIVICRAGAMTVSEVASAGLAAIFIPFPHAIDDHQTANANVLASEGAAYLMPQSIASVDKLKEIITDLNINRDKLLKMKAAAAEFGRHDAAEIIADACMEFVR